MAYRDVEARPAQPHHLPTRLRQRRSRPVGHGASRRCSPAVRGAGRRGESVTCRREVGPLVSPTPMPSPGTRPGQFSGAGQGRRRRTQRRTIPATGASPVPSPCAAATWKREPACLEAAAAMVKKGTAEGGEESAAGTRCCASCFLPRFIPGLGPLGQGSQAERGISTHP